jgi:pyruvate kinase
MVRAGLDVVRLNFSHGSHKDHRSRLIAIRRINKTDGRAVKIMQDLEGQRIRIGAIKKDIALKKNQVLFLTQKFCMGDPDEVHFDYMGNLACIRKGMSIFIDDGKITLLVDAVERSRLKTRVLIGGVLKEHKGVNIPDAALEFDAITEKDKTDLEFGIEHKVDFIAQSFVNEPKDIRLIRSIVGNRLPKCKIFAKIESRAGLKNLDGIIVASDGILVARGDLGVCLPIYEVAIIQKEIVKRCKELKKPVIVATQMLDSMTEELLPTRAEVSDVSNAIIDGAGYCMLSSETAVGKHPDRVVSMMNTIIKYTELYTQGRFKPLSQ